MDFDPVRDKVRVSDTAVNVWCDVYVKERHEDPHSVFAERMMLDRHEAKKLCYMVIYNVPFFKPMLTRCG